MPQEPHPQQSASSTVQGTGAGLAAGSATHSAAPPPDRAGAALSEELVRQVADRVYALLQAELRLDFERRRMTGLRPSRWGGR